MAWRDRLGGKAAAVAAFALCCLVPVRASAEPSTIRQDAVLGHAVLKARETLHAENVVVANLSEDIQGLALFLPLLNFIAVDYERALKDELGSLSWPLHGHAGQRVLWNSEVGPIARLIASRDGPRPDFVGRGSAVVLGLYSYRHFPRSEVPIEFLRPLRIDSGDVDVRAQLLLSAGARNSDGLSTNGGRSNCGASCALSLRQSADKQENAADAHDYASSSGEEHQLRPPGHILLGFKILFLSLLFIGGLAGCCLSLLRCSDALERVIDGRRRAGWKVAGWYGATLGSAGIGAGALT
jgi:hypothetical protein